MARLFDRAWMGTATTGTGTITLGSAQSGYQTFSSAGVSDQDLIEYELIDGTAWEHGTGTYTASGTTLTRTLIQSSTGSLLNLSGSATCFITAGAADIQPYSYAPMFGSGSDGAVTISSGTTTLTRDMTYSSLTITGGSLVTNGYVVRVSGILDISSAPAGAIKWNGANGITGQANSTPGVGQNFTKGGTLPSMGCHSTGTTNSAGAGGNGQLNAGGNGASATSTDSVYFGGTGGSGGAGGSGSSGAGGAGGTQNGGTILPFPILYPENSWTTINTSSTAVAAISSAQGSAGGGGAGGSGSANGSGGGGGALPGGTVAIYARFINRGASTAVGAIQAIGGTGGGGGTNANANCGGGGGAGGGGGGIVLIVIEDLLGSTATNAIDVSGGTGGAGGNGVSTGTGGHGGNQGNSGNYIIYNLRAGTGTTGTNNTLGQTGSAASGVTGGPGGSSTVTQANL